MKRSVRLLSVLFAVLLLGSALSLRLALTAAADDPVILMVTGYRINEPDPDTMPFYSASILYVPTDMFVALGLNCSDQTPYIILSNMKSGVILSFDTVSGTVSDSNSTYRVAAIVRNGVCFVPFEFTADRLGLAYRIFDVSPAPFARVFYPDDNALSDAAFQRYYQAAAPTILAQYRDSGTSVSTPGTSAVPSSSAAPTQSTPPPTTPPLQYEVRLVIDGLEHASIILSSLRSVSISAVFRVTLADAAQNGELLRQIVAEGHGIVFSGDIVQSADSLNLANQALFHATRTVSRAVLFESAPDQATMDRLTAAGYCPMVAGYSFSGSSRAELTQAYDLLTTGGATLLLPDDQAPAILSSLLRMTAADAPTFARLSELTVG